jgi:hypothetical protein
MTFENKRLIGIITAVAILLSIPFVSMRLGLGFNWSLMDFVIVAILLLATGLACEFVLRKVRSTGYRLAICAAILFALFVVWAELAVGLIGTRFAGS